MQSRVGQSQTRIRELLVSLQRERGIEYERGLLLTDPGGFVNKMLLPLWSELVSAMAVEGSGAENCPGSQAEEELNPRNVLGDREVVARSSGVAKNQKKGTSAAVSRIGHTIIGIMKKEIMSLYIARASILEKLNALGRARVEYQGILSILFLTNRLGTGIAEEEEEISGNHSSSDDFQRMILEKLQECDAQVGPFGIELHMPER